MYNRLHLLECTFPKTGLSSKKQAGSLLDSHAIPQEVLEEAKPDPLAGAAGQGAQPGGGGGSSSSCGQRAGQERPPAAAAARRRQGPAGAAPGRDRGSPAFPRERSSRQAERGKPSALRDLSSPAGGGEHRAEGSSHSPFSSSPEQQQGRRQ